MNPIDQLVRPGVGLGPLVLGAFQSKVRSLLGDPPEIGVMDKLGGTSHEWTYEALGLVLTFDGEYDYRLSCIETYHERARLGEVLLIGILEADLLCSDFGDLGTPVLDEEFAEEFAELFAEDPEELAALGRDFEWDDVSLICSIHDGRVESVSIMPLYDPTGSIPQWPTDS